MMKLWKARKARNASFDNGRQKTESAVRAWTLSSWISRGSVAGFAADGILLDRPFTPSRSGRRLTWLAAALAIGLSGPVDSVASTKAIARSPSTPVRSAASIARPIATVPPTGAFIGLSFEEWMAKQYDVSFEKLLANISPAGAAKGAVVASPSKQDPDYFYVWVRDAALVMDVVFKRYATETGSMKARLEQTLKDYVEFSRSNQQSWAEGGLGEPKFYADGRPYDQRWCRPQNDGPALRALTLSHYAFNLLDRGQADYVHSKLYAPELPASTVIKADLEFVAHHWKDTTCDLWEEVFADHFYTRLTQLSALRTGAKLAQQLGDEGAARYYLEVAKDIHAALEQHWSDSTGLIGATLNFKGGHDYKYSNIDIAVVLGVLHAGFDSGEFSPLDDRVLATAQKIEESFRGIYSVNDPGRFPGLGTAIGRYPEDKYSGQANKWEGNPWILTTAAMGELNYRLAAKLRAGASLDVTSRNLPFLHAAVGSTLGGQELKAGMKIQAGSKEMAQLVAGLVARGDAFMKRVRMHANPDGSMAEQIDRNSGYMVSARDLTWSYASFITAFWAR